MSKFIPQKHQYNPLERTNRRKTNKARLTQVIDVPKMIGIPMHILDENNVPTVNPDKRRGTMIPNPNKFAGRKKFIFHARPTVS